MSASPNYAAAPRLGSGVISSADSNRITPSASTTIFTAGASGSRLDRATIQATGTTTQGIVRLFLHDGTNFRLIKEVPILPVVPSATQLAYAVDVAFDGGIPLPVNWSLRASTEKAESFVVTAYGGDF